MNESKLTVDTNKTHTVLPFCPVGSDLHITAEAILLICISKYRQSNLTDLELSQHIQESLSTYISDNKLCIIGDEKRPLLLFKEL